ncbi:MAG: hypothetical protein LBH19_10665 [Dysgonamonadaceae bacterium]|jgi:hypothetical protein|nr:hypothetical protein [Dysgonamonadaceae bacterium]
MNVRVTFVLFIFLLSGKSVCAQISYGGTPLFPDGSSSNNPPGLKSSNNPPFIEMPAFDLDSVLRLDALNRRNMRGSFSFAHKFYTHIERGKDGNERILVDGARVWQVGVHSKGAYSINLLFTEFHVPEGAKLFLYNTDHSYVIGSFDHRNNSPAGLLPVRPVSGESIIVEYSEPADAAFPGRLVIGEVNHDYRGILRGEPGPDLSNFSCMTDVLCGEVEETTIRSTLLVMINGTVACTGTLLNNTANDGAPYVLTAVHCLNDGMNQSDPIHFQKEWEYYVNKAGTVIVFFNYNRPVCGTQLKGTEEMSMATAYPRTIIEGKDIALLELHEKPPGYYNAYYTGWNIDVDAKPYTNIHHPYAAVKKYNFYKDNLTWTSFFTKVFDANSHLKVAAWTTGSTYFGSSGSPLFDANHAIIGGLSGGYSLCGATDPSGNTYDAFFALAKGWETNDPANQLKTYLDPGNTGTCSIAGMDPNRQKPVLRIGNVPYNNGYNLVTTRYTGANSGFVFGNSNLNVNEFAEEFNPEYEAELYGAYLFIPPMPATCANGVEIRIYEGTTFPEQLIAQQSFRPQFLDYSKTNGAFGLNGKDMETAPTENFVRFDRPVKIGKKFFIAYRIDNAQGSQFAVYNTQSSGSGKTNTAWINKEGTWVRSYAYTPQPVSTSLAIQALLSYTDDVRLPVDQITQIRYIRNQNCVVLPNTSEGSGQVSIYAVSGQLVQQIPVSEAQASVTVHPQPAGTLGIARVIRGNEIYTGKFIY